MPLALTDDQGDIAWQASYRPFGKISITLDTLPERFTARFPGQYSDTETGLYYNYFRDYDPELGRYIHSDPIGLAGGINTYGYVLGNPLRYTDPLGLDIYLQNTPQVAGLHQRITVKNVSGSYSQSFAPEKRGDNEGSVYEDNREKTTSESCTASTKEQDDAAIKHLKSQLGDKAYYHPLVNSCRTYSQSQYSFIKSNIVGVQTNILTRPSKGLF